MSSVQYSVSFETIKSPKIVWSQIWKYSHAGSRCNCVRHAKLCAPDSFAYANFPGLCKKRPADMHMTVHVCALVSKPTYMQHEYYILCLQRIPNSRTFPMSFMTCTYACKMIANMFRRSRAFNILHGRFCKGRTQLHMQMCPGGHNCIMQQRPGRHYCIFNNVLRIILHRGHNCMRHRLGTFFRFSKFPLYLKLWLIY